VVLARLNKSDFIDAIYNGISKFCMSLHGLVVETQTGQLRWYNLTLAAAVLLVISIGVLL
jgi:hypothetical protein